jgi:hypothetical protein
MGFKPMIPASERAKTVHALDCSATVTGTCNIKWNKYNSHYTKGSTELNTAVLLSKASRKPVESETRLPSASAGLIFDPEEGSMFLRNVRLSPNYNLTTHKNVLFIITAA